MRTILVVFEYPTLNGGEYSFLTTLEHLDRSEFHIEALAPAPSDLADALAAHDVPVHRWHVRDANGTRFDQTIIRNRLGEAIRGLRPELVHANSLSMARLLGPVARTIDVPSIGHLRDIIRLSQQAIVDLNQNNRLLSVSQATLHWHVEQGLDPDRSRVCYNGIDTHRFRYRPARRYLHRELHLPQDVRFIGTIGQLGLRKGTDVFLRVAERLSLQSDDLHFIVVGQQNSRKPETDEFCLRLRAHADSPRLRGRVHFLGRRTDIARLLNELTLLIHTARQEPLGRVLLEAAACETAFVATDVGGTREIIGAGGGTIVPVDDRDAMAAAAARLLADDSLRRSVSTNNRRHVLERFESESAARRLTEHYRELAQAM